MNVVLFVYYSFSYGRCIPCCGINNIHFLGDESDWKSLIKKTEALKQYAVTEEWKSYIDNLTPILTRFHNTYNNEVDVKFWNSVMNMEDGRLGSGSTTYVSGWILNFFGMSGRKVDVGEIPSESIDVNVKIDNKLTGVKKTVQILGGK